MPLKQTKIIQNQAPLSQVLIFSTMMFACFMWLLQASMSIAPSLWDDGPYIGHNIHAEIAPLVSVVEQYERISADIDRTNHASPDDSAAHQLYSHYTDDSKVSSAAVDSDIDPTVAAVIVTAASSPSLQYQTSTTYSEHNTRHYNGCYLCSILAAALLPLVIILVDSRPIEPISILIETNSSWTTSYIVEYLRPLSRAPPSTLLG